MGVDISNDADFNNAGKIVNLNNPTLDQDGATKFYVDNAVLSAAIAVREVDGAPLIAQANTIEFDQAAGFTITDQTGGVARVSGSFGVSDHGALTGLGDDDHTQYHNDARANTWLGTRSTTNLSEGTNQYFTDERAQDAVGNILIDSGRIDFVYNDVSNTITADIIANSITNTELAANTVLDSIIRDSAGLSVIGRATSTTGDPADIVAGTDAYVLRRSGTTLSFGQVATGGIANNAVTNALLAGMTQATFKGRATGAGTGDPTDLTVAQAIAILNTGTGLDATTYNGLAHSVPGNRWGVVPSVGGDGVFEVGRYIDFHNSDASAVDYAVRLETNGTSTDLYINNNKIFHTGNDGAGSGLDADTLDGLTGTSYVNTASTQTITGAKTFSATTTFNGDVNITGTTTTIGNASTDNVVFNADVASHFIPNVSSTYDLGSGSFKWRNLYLDAVTAVNGTFTSTLNAGTATITNAMNAGSAAISGHLTSASHTIAGHLASSTATFTSTLNGAAAQFSGTVTFLGNVVTNASGVDIGTAANTFNTIYANVIRVTNNITDSAGNVLVNTSANSVSNINYIDFNKQISAPAAPGSTITRMYTIGEDLWYRTSSAAYKLGGGTTWEAKSSSFTAVSGGAYYLTNNATMTLPSIPTTGTTIRVASGAHTLTVATNSKTIYFPASNSSTTKSALVTGTCAEFLYNGTQWLTISMMGAFT